MTAQSAFFDPAILCQSPKTEVNCEYNDGLQQSIWFWLHYFTDIPYSTIIATFLLTKIRCNNPSASDVADGHFSMIDHI
jgi:hypothetical protein